jgi:signal peptidase II
MASVIALVDQLTKEAAISSLTQYVRVPVLGDVLGWYLTFNDSAAFSLGFGITWIFTLISSGALVFVLARAHTMQNLTWLVMAGCLAGGVLGNLIDRLTRAPGFGSGMVVDFIQIPFGFPIFNVADCFITITMVLVAIRVAVGDKVGGASHA